MIYLDYAATSPLDPRVFEVMQRYFAEHFGNPSSIHRYGQVCRKAIDEARNSCIESLGAFSAHEIIFTGSGTESNNMAVFGAAFARREQGKHIVVSAMEHPAVMEPARYLRDNFDFKLTEVQPNVDGLIDPKSIADAMRPDTILVSVMMVNNEVGSIQHIIEIAKIVREHGALFHTDACQAPGYTDITVDHIRPDLMSLNGGKIYGPKGVGLLYVREGVKITPWLMGGGQEFRMRAGTENVANIVGFAKALELILMNSKKQAEAVGALRDELLEALLKLDGIRLNGTRAQRAPNNINIHTPGISGESLVMRLDMEGLAASSGLAAGAGGALLTGASRRGASESPAPEDSLDSSPAS